ncbi:MAG: DUF1778 domain-containing protein [Acidobacteriia bacterium]|nr:DUF1778 domain-containing protein [Terriglobia bacterium]
MKRPEMNMRFDTRAQVETIRRAAKLRKWSFNRFVVEAAFEAAKSLTANPPSEPLMVAKERPALNQ